MQKKKMLDDEQKQILQLTVLADGDLDLFPEDGALESLEHPTLLLFLLAGLARLGPISLLRLGVGQDVRAVVLEPAPPDARAGLRAVAGPGGGQGRRRGRLRQGFPRFAAAGRRRPLLHDALKRHLLLLRLPRPGLGLGRLLVGRLRRGIGADGGRQISTTDTKTYGVVVGSPSPAPVLGGIGAVDPIREARAGRRDTGELLLDAGHRRKLVDDADAARRRGCGSSGQISRLVLIIVVGRNDVRRAAAIAATGEGAGRRRRGRHRRGAATNAAAALVPHGSVLSFVRLAIACVAFVLLPKKDTTTCLFTFRLLYFPIHHRLR